MKLDEHIFSAVDGIIGTVVFGKIYDTEHFKMQFLDMLSEAMDMLGSFSAEDFFPNAAGRLIDRLTGLISRRDRIFRRLDDFFDAVINQHLNPSCNKLDDKNCRSDPVQALVELWKDQGSVAVPFTRDHVKAMLFVSLSFQLTVMSKCITILIELELCCLMSRHVTSNTWEAYLESHISYQIQVILVPLDTFSRTVNYFCQLQNLRFLLLDLPGYLCRRN